MNIIEKYKNPSEKDIPHALDLAVKAFEGKDGGYLIEDTGVCYCNYMTKEEWLDFYNCMSRNDFKAISDKLEEIAPEDIEEIEDQNIAA